jgi:hypothetical protein
MHEPQEDSHMESMDNFRERFEALEQQMNVMGAHTCMVERRRRWWRGIVCAVLLLSVTDCNRNRPGLQSARFWDHILCLYRPRQDHIKCH